MSHYLLDNWLMGTTCRRARNKQSVMFENDTHIVLKHNAHSDYTDRCSGVQNCPAYARLYLKLTLEQHIKERPCGGWACQSLREWTGRINPRKVKKECAAIGITFT